MGEFKIKFWGVRGSLACFGPEYQKYGGSTSCIEVQCGSHTLIFDAGSGLRALGEDLKKGKLPIKADVFLSHTHLDHICGFPFFTPFYCPESQLSLWAGNLLPEHNIKKVLQQMMTEPLFPVPIDIFRAQLSFHDFKAGETLHPHDGIEIVTTALNHPNNATGYRINYEGKSFCYVTDTEHQKGKLDNNIIELIRDADIVVYDSTYTDEEYENHIGWGHSTWQEGVRLSQKANVKKLVLFHHDPSHDDKFMDDIAQRSSIMLPGTVVAQEQQVFNL